MLRCLKSMEFEIIDKRSASIQCGVHTLYLLVNWPDLYVEYEVGGHVFMRLESAENLENAIWEWLCTLDRYTNPEHRRRLGSYRLSSVEAA